MNVDKTIRKILTIQLIFTGLASAASLFVDVKTSWSAAVGGGIGIVTTACFAFWVFSGGIGAPAKKIVRRFYVGEVVKLVLTGVLFGVAIIWLDVSFLPLLLTYTATLLAYWLVLPLSL